jgi:hypothetical protein
MARTPAQVDGARLVLPEREASPIIVDTPAWFAWLEHATTFAFNGPSGRFTARKERWVLENLSYVPRHPASSVSWQGAGSDARSP